MKSTEQLGNIWGGGGVMAYFWHPDSHSLAPSRREDSRWSWSLMWKEDARASQN